MGKEIVKIKDLTIRYGNANEAVKNVSFDIEKGDFLLIVGENGSGKSTLIKGILGLLPASSGSIEFLGDTAKKIGYLPQANEISGDFPARVSEVVLSGYTGKKGLFSFYSARDKKKATEILKYLDIMQLWNKSVRELSGGERQKVLLARALVSATYCGVCTEKNCSCHEETFCHTNGLIVLDEPSNGLDPVANSNLYLTLDRLRRDKGMTVVMVSHLVDSASMYANKVLHMDNGIKFFGSRDSYLETEAGKRFSKGQCGEEKADE